MIQGWAGRVGGCIPRGFSRYYIVGVLGEGPRTGKEIMDHAAEQSGGAWRPSPGLIYPVLGRLLEEGLVEEEDGRYALTKRGRSVSEDVGRIGDVIRRQLDVLFRLGEAGRFAAMDVLERMSMMGSVLRANSSRMTDEETDRYRRFLESELEGLGRRIDVEGPAKS